MKKILVGLLGLSGISFVFGNESKEKRIVNGKEVNPPLKYNFITPIFNGHELCSGTLIHPSWVLTAGHCMIGHTFQGTPGSSRHNISFSSSENKIYHEVDFRVVHPLYVDVLPEGFDDYFSQYDAALYHLKTPATIKDPNIQLIELDKTGQFSQAGTMSTVIGWGMLDLIDFIRSNLLMEVDVPITSDENCRTAYPFIDSSNICAGYPEGTRDACYGDSGGPLFTTDPVSGKYIQNGIVSSGKECALAGFPGTYTHIPSIVPWVEDTIQNAKDPCTDTICGVGKCYGDSAPDYTCICPITHTGKNCEIEICPNNPSSTCKISHTWSPVEVTSKKTEDSNLLVSGLPSIITSDIGLAIHIKVAHIRSGFLNINLISPSGKQISLASNFGDQLANCYEDTIFGDSFSTINSSTVCPFKEVGSIDALQNLIGEPLNGLWKLRIENFHDRRTTTILGWGIKIISCRPGYDLDGLTCKPNSRTQKTLTFSVIQRFLFNGLTIDTHGSGNSFNYNDGKALVFSTIPRNSDSFNKALNINISPAVSSKKIQLTDSSFTLEIVFRVNTMKEFDLFSLLTARGLPLNTSPLRIQITNLGRLKLYSKSRITFTSPPVITTGNSYYLVIAFRNSQMFIFLNDSRLASMFSFPSIPPSNYLIFLSRGGHTSIDELAFFDMSLNGIQALSRNDDF